MNIKSVVMLNFVALLSWGCGGSPGLGTPVAQFPEREALEGLAAESATLKLDAKIVEVDEWTIEADSLPAGASYPAEGFWDRTFVAATKGQPALRLSPELRCAARETARYFTEKGGLPGEALRQYMVARCGSSLASVDARWLQNDVPDGMSDEDVETAIKGWLGKFVAGATDGYVGDVGLGFARGNDRVVSVIYRGRPGARVQGFGTVNGTEVTLTGKLSAPADLALALVTQGKYGVDFCEPNRAVTLPEFEFTCSLQEGDEQASIEISTKRQNQVLMRMVASGLVRTQDDVGLTWTANALGSTGESKDLPGFRRELLALLNQVRREANTSEVTLAGKQSALNQKLVSHFFKASFEGDTEQTDLVALGLLAGWDVEGMIRDGGILANFEGGSTSAGCWLTGALASPTGRWVLLDEEMAKVAIGADSIGKAGVMGLVTTYAFFGGQDHTVDEDAVFDELRKRRLALGQAEPRRLPKTAAMQQALKKIASGELPTGEALEEAMQRVSQSERRSIAGFVLETSSLQMLRFDDELLAGRAPEVEIGVTHYKAPGGAWGQYVLLVMVREAGASPLRTARTAESGARL